MFGFFFVQLSGSVDEMPQRTSGALGGIGQHAGLEPL